MTGLTVTRRARGRVPALARHVALVLLGLFMIYPLLWLVSASLKPDNLIFTDESLVPSAWDLGNYAEGWNATGLPFTVYFANSLLVAGLSVVGNILSCTFAAYAFARLRLPVRRLLFACMMATLLLPFHVVVVPQYVLFNNLGWVGTIAPLVVPKFLALDAFFIFLIIQFLRSLPRQLDQAAAVDGCGPYRVFWYVILPLLRPAILTTAIFSFLWTWDDFFGPLLYLNRQAGYTVPLGLQMFEAEMGGEASYGPLFAMSVLALLPVVGFFIVFQRRIIDGIATTGLKE